MQPLSSVRIYFVTFFFSGLLTIAALAYFHDAVDQLQRQLVTLSNFWTWCRDVSVAATVGGGTTAILHRWGWRWIRVFPVLEGRWEGWSFSADRPQWRASVLEIAQNGLGIKAITYSAKLDNRRELRNISEGFLAGILQSPGETGTFRILNFYITISYEEGAHRSVDADHPGVHILDLLGEGGPNREIKGRYINTRQETLNTNKGTGIVHWRFAGRRRRKNLYWHDDWAMPQPTYDPSNAPLA